jgi:hypothetical protein
MKDYYVRVQAESYTKARELFVELFARKHMPTPLTWAFQYPESEMNKRYYPMGEYCAIIQGYEEEIKDLYGRLR